MSVLFRLSSSCAYHSSELILDGCRERNAEQLNGLEEGEDAMTDEEGEGEAGTADWRVRANRPKKQTDCNRKGRTRSNSHTVQRLVQSLHDG